MLSIKYSVNKRDDYPPPSPFTYSIASTVFQKASAFRIDQRRRDEFEFSHKEQKLKAKLRVIAKQRDTYVQYALHLEANLAAGQACEDRCFLIKSENDQLRATVERYQALISEQAVVISNLNNTRAADQSSIKTLRAKRLTDRVAVDSWQKEVTELNDINDRLHKENDVLQLVEEELSSAVAEKDQQLIGLRGQYTKAIAVCNKFQEDVTKQKKLLGDALKQLNEQKSLNRKIACTLHDNEESWKAQAEELTRKVSFAQAETRNNSANYDKVLRSKDIYIKHLDDINQYRINANQKPNNDQILFQVLSGYQEEVQERDQSITDLKTDIQNLLRIKQQDTNQLTAYLNENRELRAQRNEAEIKSEQLQGQLDRKNIFVIKLQKIITHEVDSTGILTEDHAILAARIKVMTAHSVTEYHNEIETLRIQLQQERTRFQELQAAHDKCDNELFEHRLEEQFRQDEMKKLRLEASTAKEQLQLVEEQHTVFDDLFSAYTCSQHRPIQETVAFVQTRLQPLYVQNQQLLSEKSALIEAFEKEKSELKAQVAMLNRNCMVLQSENEMIAPLYWDMAITQHDQLHEELAKYKRKCGVEHYVESRPASRLVHERRLLQYALTKAGNVDKSLLPREYFDPNFLGTSHPAVIQALQKLWPDLWWWHQEHAAWIPLTVPVLTTAGPIILDDKTLVVSNARLEQFKKELDALDMAAERDHIERSNAKLEMDGPYSLSKPQSQGEFDSENHTSSSNEPAARSTAPSSNRTNDTSPSQSAIGDRVPQAMNGLVNLEYNKDTSQLMTKDEYDALPTFAKKKAAALSTQVKQNNQVAGYMNGTEMNEDEFLALHGHGIEAIDRNSRDQVIAHKNTRERATSKALRLVAHAKPASERKEDVDPLAWVEDVNNFWDKHDYERLDDDQKREYKRIVALEAFA